MQSKVVIIFTLFSLFFPAIVTKFHAPILFSLVLLEFPAALSILQNQKLPFYRNNAKVLLGITNFIHHHVSERTKPSRFQNLNSSVQLPTGLNNLGNICYLNALLQCLYHLPPFREYILSNEFKLDSVGSALKRLFIQMVTLSNNSEPFNHIATPVELVRLLGIDVRVQQDAEELFLRLINDVEECECTQLSKKNSTIRIQLEQQIIANQANFTKSSNQSHLDLSLPVFEGLTNLSNALQLYFEPVLITDYKTANHGYQFATKGLKMKSTPPVLAIHLQRFGFDPVDYELKKINSVLDIPLRLHLDETGLPFLDGVDRNATGFEYSLTSVLIHEGAMDAGHYYAFVRPSPVNASQVWYEVNDERVKPVDTQTVLDIGRGQKSGTFHPSNRNAYMLFYVKTHSSPENT